MTAVSCWLTGRCERQAGPYIEQEEEVRFGGMVRELGQFSL